MAAELLRKRICEVVLPPSKPFAIAPSMLQQQDLSVRSANSRHLLKRSNRIWEGACCKGRNYGVKALIGKRKSLCIRQQESMSVDNFAARCLATFNISLLTSTAIIRQSGG